MSDGVQERYMRNNAQDCLDIADRIVHWYAHQPTSKLCTEEAYYALLGQLRAKIQAALMDQVEAIHAPTILRAMDRLGSALADHGHVWTDDERSSYEDAVNILTDHAIRMLDTSEIS